MSYPFRISESPATLARKVLFVGVFGRSKLIQTRSSSCLLYLMGGSGGLGCRTQFPLFVCPCSFHQDSLKHCDCCGQIYLKASGQVASLAFFGSESYAEFLLD